jgi:hypothetical protein
MRLPIKSGFRFQKKYIVFFAVVPLLLLTGLIQVECPVCKGTGQVSSAPGMENVEILELDYTPRPTTYDACTGYTMYVYDIKMSVKNWGQDDARGYVELTLINLEDNSVKSQQNVALEVPGNMSLQVSYTVRFPVNETVVIIRDKIIAEVAIKGITDKTCNGTGKLSLNSWILANYFKDSLVELGRQRISIIPDVDSAD